MFAVWDDTLMNSGQGCIDLELDHFLASAEVSQFLCSLVDDTLAMLRDHHSTFSPDELNDLVRGTSFYGDWETSKIITLVERFKSLLGCP